MVMKPKAWRQLFIRNISNPNIPYRLSSGWLGEAALKLAKRLAALAASAIRKQLEENSQCN